MDVMGPIGWIVLGGLAGWIASKFVGTDKEQGVIGNIVAGILGAVLGGWLFTMLGSTGVTGFNIWSFLVALVGAVVVLLLWKAVTGKKAE